MPPSSSDPGRHTAGTVGGRRVVLLDSISYLGPDDVDQVVVSGSHGGEAAGRYALEHPPWLVIFNDAGVGKDSAGIAALPVLAGAGIAAAAVAHTSARIGDAADTWEHGLVTHVNPVARRLGVTPGMEVQELVGRLD